MVLEKTDLTRRANDREAKGQCRACGQQLYRFQPADGAGLATVVGMMLTGRVTTDKQGRRLRLVPLTIPDLVQAGQCLRCERRKQTMTQLTIRDDAAHLTTAAASCEEQQVYRSFSDDAVIYVGPRDENGQSHGQGEIQWTNGDVYRGDLDHDQITGQGTLQFANCGGEYTGEWQNGWFQGHGTRRYPNGDAYVGAFVRGQRHGQGRFYYANGDLYWGDFEDNAIHGQGRYYYASGQRFEGHFLRGRRYGPGKLQRADGGIEIFQYVRDERVGVGIRWSQDREQAWRVWHMPDRYSNSKQTTTTHHHQHHHLMDKEPIDREEAVQLVYEIERIGSGSLLEAKMLESMAMPTSPVPSSESLSCEFVVIEE